jgi:membrane protein implicated in regulation of membrane protease activity
MFVLVRAVTYAAFFIGFVLVYLPNRFLSWSGIVAPATTGAPQVAGMIMVTIGTAIALWCVFTFVFIGKGTPEAKYELRRMKDEIQSGERSTSNAQHRTANDQSSGQRPR